MAQIDNMLISLEEYTLNANQVKDLVLERLENDGLITNQNALDYAEKWQIIIIKSNSRIVKTKKGFVVEIQKRN